MAYLKPQSPLQDKDGDYIYPLTTADQIIMKDGSRFNNIIELESKAGFIYPLASANIPKGFLLCNGAEYGREEYPELFAAIGTMYGVGDGSTTFNVPNLQTRIPVGAGEGYELGNVGGEENHKHELVDAVALIDIGDTGVFQNFKSYTFTPKGYIPSTGEYHSGSTERTTATNVVGNTSYNNNMQPYTVVNYIIATGKNTGVSVADIVTGVQALPLGVEYGGTGATSVEDARTNLGITPDNIGAMSMELLWENASPSSAFSRQEITLSDISGYDFLFIVTKGGAVVNNIWNPKQGGIYLSYININGTDAMSLYARGIFFVDNSTIEIHNCGKVYIETSRTYSVDNNSIRPYQIYGIKGVSV